MGIGTTGPQDKAAPDEGRAPWLWRSGGRGAYLRAALRVLSASILAAALIYLFLRVSREAAKPRKPSLAEELTRLRSEGIKYMDVKWGDWQTRLEGESLSRALAALDMASEPLWIGWSGDEWIKLGKITVTTASEQVRFLIKTRKTIGMRPLIYGKWARAGHRDLRADRFFGILRSMKQVGFDPGDTDWNGSGLPAQPPVQGIGAGTKGARNSIRGRD